MKRYVTKVIAKGVEIDWVVNRKGEDVVKLGNNWGVYDKAVGDFIENNDFANRGEALKAAGELNAAGNQEEALVADAAPPADVQDPQDATVDRYVASPYRYYGNSNVVQSWSIWDRVATGWLQGPTGDVWGRKEKAEEIAANLNAEGEVDHGTQPSDDVEQYVPGSLVRVNFAEIEARVLEAFEPPKEGDLVHYRFTTMKGDTWQQAIFAGETRLTWLLLDDDNEVRGYFKDRVEVRKGPIGFQEGGIDDLMRDRTDEFFKEGGRE